MPDVKIIYKNGEWIIKYNNRIIAKVYVDYELYEMCSDRMGPYSVDERIYVEVVEDGA